MGKINKIGSVSLEKLKGISYKLGLLRVKGSPIQEIEEIPETVNSPEGYQYPHQKEDLDKVYREEILPKIEKAKQQARRVIF